MDEITGDPNEIKVKNKNKRRITRQERNKIKELHHAELLCRLARVHLVNRALESDALRDVWRSAWRREDWWKVF